MNTHILLADDHKLFRMGLRGLLAQQAGMEVVAEANDGQEAVRAALESEPDVVVMDISMPRMNGIEATRRITEALPEAKVLCLSMHTHRRFVLAVLEAGASGYLVKECALEELLQALRCVEADQVYLSPAVAGHVVEAYRAEHVAPSSSALRLEATSRLQTRHHETVVAQPPGVEVTSADAAFMDRVSEVVENHLAFTTFSVELLAEEVGLSRRQLDRKLMALTSLTGSRFIQKLRLERAARLLKQGYGNVTEVARAVGFHTAKHFSKLFRQTFGVCPSDYSRREA